MQINNYDDLKKLIGHNPIYKLNYKYRLPGNSYYVNLGEYKGKLFLEVDIAKPNIVQVEWKLSIDRFIKEANMFNFKDMFTVDWYPGTFIKCPYGFNEKTENLFIETLVNLTFDIGIKYGLI